MDENNLDKDLEEAKNHPVVDDDDEDDDIEFDDNINIEALAQQLQQILKTIQTDLVNKWTLRISSQVRSTITKQSQFYLQTIISQTLKFLTFWKDKILKLS